MSVQTADATATSPSGQSVPGETCARCHTTQDWGADSWCPNCGFYPSLDADGINDKSWQDHMPVEEEAVPEGNLFAALPGWFWILMGGITAILLLGLVVRTQAADEEGLRGMIALTTVAFAFVAIAIPHFIACRYAMKHDRRISVTDTLVSWFTVWQPTISQLPATRRRIWSMSWGLTSAITAVLIIGGIDYGAPFRNDQPVTTKPFGNKVIQAVTGAAKVAGQNNGAASMQDALGQLSDPNTMAAGGAPTSMEDAMNSLASMPDQLQQLTATAEADAAAMAAADSEIADESMLCIVYGVVTDEDKTPTGFLFAAKPRNKYQHIAEISAEDLAKNDYRRLAARLSRKIQKKPAIETEYEAVWVDPVLVCKIRYIRLNEDGTVYGPVFDSIVREGTRRSASRNAEQRRGR
jgi:hypothetical protein